jgi:hypothetical protein
VPLLQLKRINSHALFALQFLLGHKGSASTDRYTKFSNFPLEGKYKSAIALTVEDARRLVEDGWQFVCNVDEHPQFRKGV